MKWQMKSKTMQSGVLTIVWGVLILFGFVSPDSVPPKAIDGLDAPQEQQNTMGTLIGLGALGSGLTTLKGRADAQKKIEGRDK